jgi:hypothetical protein
MNRLRGQAGAIGPLKRTPERPRGRTWRGLVLRTAAAVLCLAVIGSCGYSMRKTGTVGSVRMGEIVNSTFEPKLGDRLAVALAGALMESGIRLDDGSPYTLSGRLEKFELRSLAEKEGVSVLYEVRVSGAFFLDGPGGERRKLRNSGLFIVTFSSEGALQRVLAGKEQAAMKALSDLSEELVASILYD